MRIDGCSSFPPMVFLLGFLLVRSRSAGLIRELLARKRSGIHQAALGDRKYRHAVVVDAIGVGVSLSRARAGGDAVGAYAGVRPGGNRDRTCADREFKVAGLELVQRALVLKKDDLSEVLAAGLKSDADLLHGRITDELLMDV